MIFFKEKLVMDCWIPALIGAAAAIGGKMMQDSSAKSMQASSMAYNAQQAADQRNWEQNMYASRYQHTMADMRSAGLNPILAATSQGLGGSVPSGASASVDTPQTYMPDIGSSAKNVAESFLKEQETETENERTKLIKNQALTELEKAKELRAAAGKLNSEESMLLKRVSQITTEINKMEHEVELIKQGKKLTEAEIQKVRVVTKQLNLTLNRLEKMDSVYKSAGGKFAAWVNALFGTINVGAAATGSALLRR